MREMKDSGIEWIGAIPINWDIAQFKKILIRNDGGLWGNDPSGQDDILVLRSTEQTIDGKWDIQSPAYRDLSNVSNVQEYLVKCGDLLITKSSGSDLHIGKTTIVDELIESLHCSFSNFIQRLRVCSKMNPRYYWYILNSNIARGQFVYLQNSTSGIGNINSKNINEIEVPIPPLDIQHTIADYLDRKCSQIDAIIARQQEVIKKLKAYKLSVITEAVTKGLNPNVPMKDSGVEWIGKIPEHWKVMKFGRCAMVKSNLVNPDDYADYPQISPDSIEKNSGRIFEYKTVKESGVISWNHLFFQGQIIYSKIRPMLNKVAIAPFDGLCSADMYPIETSNNAQFLVYMMLSDCFTSQVGLVTENRVKMPKINQNELNAIMVVIPPRSEQEIISKYLQKECFLIDARIDRKQKLVGKLIDYKKSLIYEVVTGKKEV